MYEVGGSESKWFEVNQRPITIDERLMSRREYSSEGTHIEVYIILLLPITRK